MSIGSSAQVRSPSEAYRKLGILDVDVLSAALSYASAKIGDVVRAAGYSSAGLGAAVYDVVDESLVTTNGINIIQHSVNSSLALVQRDSELLTFEMGGAIGDGVADDTAAIANIVSRAQGKKIKGVSGKIYRTTTSQELLASTDLDLGGARLLFDTTGSEKGLLVGTGASVSNGTVEVDVSSPVGSGETACPVAFGDFQGGDGVTNARAHDLTIITNKPNGNGVSVFGGSNNIEIKRIVFPASATINAPVEVHWGGQASLVEIQHPHDIVIDNIRCDGMTSTTVGGAVIFLSSCYNIKVSNVNAENVIRGVAVTCGDYGDDYSVSNQVGKIGQNITLDGINVRDCFKAGLTIDGYTQYGLSLDSVTCDTTSGSNELTNVSSTTKLFVGRVIDLGTSGALGEYQIEGISGTSVFLNSSVGSTTSGSAVEGGAWSLSINVSNSIFECDKSSSVIAPLLIQAADKCKFDHTVFSGGYTDGVSFSNWVHRNEWTFCDFIENNHNGVNENRSGKANENVFFKCRFGRNNLLNGTGRTTSCSVFLSSKRNQILYCDFGQRSQETVMHHVSIDNTGESNDIVGCRFHGIGSSLSGHAVFKNGHGSSTTFGLRTLAQGNWVDSSLAYQVSPGTPMLNERRTNRYGLQDNVVFYDVAAPASGDWLRGDEVQQAQPAVGSPTGWLCTAAGAPGTWAAKANL